MAENSNTSQGTGYLLVQVSAADQALPVSGANVIISKQGTDGEEVIRIMTTDRNGRTETIELPAPPAENSLEPGNPDTYYKYNIRVDYPGYYTVEYRDVPIFSGNKAIQPVSLVPLPEGQEKGKKVIVSEREPNL